MKHATGKRVKVVEFGEGEYVSIKILKAIPHRTDLWRLPCVILKKSPGRSPTYKLICEYGLIKISFTAVNLMLFPFFKIRPPTNILNLTDVYKLFQMTDVMLQEKHNVDVTRKADNVPQDTTK